MDIKNFWTEGNAGQIPNSGHDLAIYVPGTMTIVKYASTTSNQVRTYFDEMNGSS